MELKCGVCFFRFQTLYPSQVSELIRCKECQQVAHKFCYLPSATGKTFICDPCSHKKKGKTKCYICGNTGLLKLTNFNEFAHPICLIFSRSSLVSSYSNLQFHVYRQTVRKKAISCDICKKSNPDVMKCFEKSCQRHAHMYCILSVCWQKEQSWKQCLEINENGKDKYLNYFFTKVRKLIKQQSNQLYKLLFSNKRVTLNQPTTLVYCPEHCNLMISCFCITDIVQDLGPWVGCDVCEKWYHCACQNVKIEDAANLKEYRCRQCMKWQEQIKTESQYSFKTYPKMHFYDFVFLQYTYQKKKEIAPRNLQKTISNIPFLPSLETLDRQFFKDPIRHMNFIPLKNHIQNLDADHLNSLIPKTKAIVGIIFKMELVLTDNIIESINKVKKNQFTYENAFLLLKKYDDEKLNDYKKLRPILMKMREIDNGNQSSEEEESEAIKILHEQIRKIEKSKIQDLEINFKNFFRAVLENQILKRAIEKYVKDQMQNYKYFESIFLYKNPGSMLNHSKIVYLYQMFHKSEEEKKKVQILKNIQLLFSLSSLEIKRNNFKIWKEISFERTIRSEKSIYLNQKKKKQKTNLFERNLGSHTNLFAQQLIHERVVAGIYKELKTNNISKQQIQRLQRVRSKVENSEYFQALNQIIKNYLRLVKQISSICPLNTTTENLTAVFEHKKVDEKSFEAFTKFMLTTLTLQINKYHPRIIEAIKVKFENYYEHLKTRRQIVQTHKEIQILKMGSKTFPIHCPKIKEIIEKDSQLQLMLAYVDNREYKNPMLIERAIPTLKNAKMFALESNLFHRLTFLNNVLTHYQLFQEALKIFPGFSIIDSGYQIPRKYFHQRSTVDYGVLSKFVRKLVNKKFPEKSVLMEKIKNIYLKSNKTYNQLSNFVKQYNIFLENFDRCQLGEIKRFSKDEIEDLINNNEKELITCEPQVLQIRLIIQIYENNLRKAQECILKEWKNEEMSVKVHTQLLKIPFHLSSETFNDLERYISETFPLKKHGSGRFILKEEVGRSERRKEKRKRATSSSVQRKY